jgi:starvation-inducible DNA-binding protein
MNPNIGLTDSDRLNVVSKLNILLADEFLLFTKTKNAHWNVEGIDFLDKHKLFDAQAADLSNIIDEVAERIRALGHYSHSSLANFLKLTQLDETLLADTKSTTYIKALLADHERIILFLRENINRVGNDYNDIGTSDFLTSLLESHEKTAWFLRSHLA